MSDRGLTCPVPEGAFTWEAEVRIDPTTNTSLEGLYTSGGMYCTQCEAEGFRRIAPFIDRPDLLSRYSVTIRADQEDVRAGPAFQRQSGGERRLSTTAGIMPCGTDPFPKPAYLFALVAGDLRSGSRTEFTTTHDRPRRVDLQHLCRAWATRTRAGYAMESLKRSMAVGRGTSIGLGNTISTSSTSSPWSDFNMGAMENKSLNVFNAKYILASTRESATDGDYRR